jgi:hypothetical protein
MMELKIGDLVQCRDNHYNRGLGIVNRVGMVAELRRKDLRILFEADDQAIWVSKMGINKITLPYTASPGLVDRLTWIIRYVSAEECELAWDESRNYHYIVVCGELSLEQIITIREYLGELFVRLKVLPRGMSRLALDLVFRQSPPS